jgi:hypothetical protein
MVNHKISYHYYKVLDESIADIPLNEEHTPTYYRVPTITRISHFQNNDEAWNMTRFTKTQHSLLPPAMTTGPATC